MWVPMGGYNECPLPVYQSVIFRHFQQQYGANILAVTGDTWVLQASRRPQTAEEALQLAKEHFIFCQYVLEDQPTLGHYADSLLKQDVWYFWWDQEQTSCLRNCTSLSLGQNSPSSVPDCAAGRRAAPQADVCFCFGGLRENNACQRVARGQFRACGLAVAR